MLNQHHMNQDNIQLHQPNLSNLQQQTHSILPCQDIDSLSKYPFRFPWFHLDNSISKGHLFTIQSFPK